MSNQLFSVTSNSSTPNVQHALRCRRCFGILPFGNGESVMAHIGCLDVHFYVECGCCGERTWLDSSSLTPHIMTHSLQNPHHTPITPHPPTPHIPAPPSIYDRLSRNDFTLVVEMTWYYTHIYTIYHKERMVCRFTEFSPPSTTTNIFKQMVYEYHIHSPRVVLSMIQERIRDFFR